MSIILGTYYNSDINLTEGQITNVIADWQDIYEEMILKKLLGYDLYTLYVTDLALSVVGSPTTQRFIDLVDGKEFSFEYGGNTISTKWMGLRNSTNLKSLIAYYVYYNYRNETENFNSGAGQVTSLTENSTKVDVRPKLISSWNKTIDLYGFIPYKSVCNWNENIDTYIHYNKLPSAYNFLLANKATYPEWIFEPIETQNIWGI